VTRASESIGLVEPKYSSSFFKIMKKMVPAFPPLGVWPPYSNSSEIRQNGQQESDQE
jgi:hypothetical protein